MKVDSKIYVIKNMLNRPCSTCGGKHEYISRASNHARCGTPVAFSHPEAVEFAKAMQLNIEQAVIVTPDDTLVVLDQSARRLRQQGGGSVALDQVFTGARSM